MVFNVFEILDMALMTAIVGYLFMDAFKVPLHHKDVLHQYEDLIKHTRFQWQDFWFACALIAPSIILHELGHKFSAMAFGYNAIFHGACSTVNLVGPGAFFNFTCLLQTAAVAMKMLGVGFIIFIPAFVSIAGSAPPLQQMIISFAGPAVHLVFWLGAAWVLKNHKEVRNWSDRKRVFVFFFKQINMFLFILNMLPIPPFDGWHFFSSLFKLFF